MVPITALKGDATIADSKEATPPQAQRVAPFEYYDFTCVVDDLWNAGHRRRGEILLKHLADCCTTFDRSSHHLMVHGVFMVQLGDGSSITVIKSSDPLFEHVARFHDGVCCPAPMLVSYMKPGPVGTDRAKRPQWVW